MRDRPFGEPHLTVGQIQFRGRATERLRFERRRAKRHIHIIIGMHVIERRIPGDASLHWRPVRLAAHSSRRRERDSSGGSALLVARGSWIVDRMGVRPATHYPWLTPASPATQQAFHPRVAISSATTIDPFNPCCYPLNPYPPFVCGTSRAAFVYVAAVATPRAAVPRSSRPRPRQRQIDLPPRLTRLLPLVARQL